MLGRPERAGARYARSISTARLRYRHGIGSSRTLLAVTVHDIDYVELYVADDRATIDYFTSAFDLVAVATTEPAGTHGEHRSTLLRGGSVQLVVTWPTSASGAVADHLERHGEGVVDIAFSCPDPQAAWRHAVDQGADPLRPPTLDDGGRTSAAVGGLGSIRHTLVNRLADRELPPGRWRALTGRDPATSTVRALDHVAVCVPAGTLSATARHYEQAFGLHFYSSEYIPVGDQAMDSIVVRSSSGGVTFTMLEPDATRRPGQIDAFLASNNSAGVQHLAFLVGDITAATRELAARGVEFLPIPDAYYDRLAERGVATGTRLAELRATGVLVDQDEWGHLMQIFTRSPHERRSLFYELIQREAARGFGSANIRALYEAVERSGVQRASAL